MKSISAALIVTGGLSTLCFSTLIGHSDTELFMGAVGLIVTSIGLVGWLKSLRETDKEPS